MIIECDDDDEDKDGYIEVITLKIENYIAITIS